MRPCHVAITPLVPWLLLLASCSSPPGPPTVDETLRRPANAPMAVELQGCRNDLHNTRLQARESARLAASTAATLAAMSKPQREMTDGQVIGAPTFPANRLYTIRFDYGSTRISLPTEGAAVLIEAAKASSLIVLRGRTDGTRDTLVEANIARERAAQVRDFLVSAGVDPSRIRATHQPSGDHVAENTSTGGRSQNRRVEIELYRAPPVALDAPVIAQR